MWTVSDGARLWMEPLEDRRLLTSYLVDIAEDESDGDVSEGDLSLREAIESANATSGVDTIEFDTCSGWENHHAHRRRVDDQRRFNDHRPGCGPIDDQRQPCEPDLQCQRCCVDANIR